jgi:hypothetical protein
MLLAGSFYNHPLSVQRLGWEARHSYGGTAWAKRDAKTIKIVATVQITLGGDAK